MLLWSQYFVVKLPSKCRKLHLSAYENQKFSGGAFPGAPRSRVRRSASPLYLGYPPTVVIYSLESYLPLK